MDRETRIKEFMGKYQLDKLPLFLNNGEYVGCLDQKLSYTKGDWRYLTSREAILNVACMSLSQIEEIINILNNPMSANVLKYVDNKQSAVEVWNGTFDEICERIDIANNKLRYCNGDFYKFEDENMSIKFGIWYRIIPESRSFAMYYGNGTVD